MGRSRSFSPSSAEIEERLTLPWPLGKLHEEDGVIEARPIKHDQADLCINVVFEKKSWRNDEDKGGKSSKKQRWVHSGDH